MKKEVERMRAITRDIKREERKRGRREKKIEANERSKMELNE